MAVGWRKEQETGVLKKEGTGLLVLCGMWARRETRTSLLVGLPWQLTWMEPSDVPSTAPSAFSCAVSFKNNHPPVRLFPTHRTTKPVHFTYWLDTVLVSLFPRPAQHTRTHAHTHFAALIPFLPFLNQIEWGCHLHRSPKTNLKIDPANFIVSVQCSVNLVPVG